MSDTNNLFEAGNDISSSSSSTDINTNSPIETTHTTNNPSGITLSNKPEGSTEQSPSEPSKWYLADGVEGKGEKPDFYVDNKYKTVLEQAKGYNESRKQVSELQKKVDELNGKIPDEYSLDLSADEKYKDIKINKEDPMTKQFIDFAKQNKMTQDTVTNILKYKADLDKAQKDSENKLIQEYTAEEIKKLGDNAPQRLNNIKTWWEQNFPDFPVERMQKMALGADFIEMLEMIKSKHKYNPVPVTGNESQPIDKLELRKMQGSPEYLNDPKYRAKVDQMYLDAYKNK